MMTTMIVRRAGSVCNGTMSVRLSHHSTQRRAACMQSSQPPGTTSCTSSLSTTGHVDWTTQAAAVQWTQCRWSASLIQRSRTSSSAERRPWPRCISLQRRQLYTNISPDSSVFYATVHSRNLLLGEFPPPQKNLVPANGCQIVCSKFFFGRTANDKHITETFF